MPIVYISIGSNLEKRYQQCLDGMEHLNMLESTFIMKQSPFYETEPVGYIDQRWFLNAVLKIKTSLAPMVLLNHLKSIEAGSGRDFHQVRFGPRTLDLDILLYDNLVLNSASLVIPHPRMHERRFVLKPLCDIDPRIVHPVFKKTIAQLLEELGDTDQKVIFYQ